LVLRTFSAEPIASRKFLPQKPAVIYDCELVMLPYHLIRFRYDTILTKYRNIDIGTIFSK